MKALEQLCITHKYTQLPDHFYTNQPISQLQQIKLVGFNKSVAKLINLDPKQANRKDFAEYFNGTKQLSGATPIATVYAGHQFGYFVSQLGDGRAMLLGEITNNFGKRYEIQVKGAGPTPYSRNADGRAVLRSTIREYLCSEAMHGLGIPTTRALCFFDSETPVYREQIERGAMLVRVAESHLRFGSFEFFYHNKMHHDLKLLIDYVIKYYYPHLQDTDNPYLSLLQTITHKTAQLIAQWQAVGFAHGVMNTDNMSLLGLTLDYGPFGFLDRYDPNYICNHSDTYGRYAFDQQARIGEWNCSALAQTLIPLITIEDAKTVLSEFKAHFKHHYLSLMSKKLGLDNPAQENEILVNDLLSLLKKNNVDYSYFFRELCYFDSSRESVNEKISDLFIDRQAFLDWTDRYKTLLAKNSDEQNNRRAKMIQENPKFILRNHLAEQAIQDAENYDYKMVDNLLTVLQSPYEEHDEFSQFSDLPPAWAEKITISCSS